MYYAPPTVAHHAAPSHFGTLNSRDLLGLWLLACAASAIVGTHGILYWDAGDYTTLAITGGRSGLFLGRPLFLLISRAIVRAGVDPMWAEPVLRWFWMLVGGSAAPAMAVLAARLGLDRPSAWLAGAMIAVSPSFAHTAHQVLTDAPALALSIAALAAAASGRAIPTGILLGAAILMRETAAIHIVAAVLLLGARRSGIAIAAMLAIIVATLWAFPAAGLARWVEALSHNATASPPDWRGIGVSMLWVFAAGPLPVAVGILGLRRETNRRVMLVAVPAAIATAALLFYPEGSYSPRYVLASAPVAFLLPAATWLSTRRRLAAVGLAIPLAMVPLLTHTSRVVAARGAVVQGQMQLLPDRSLVVPAHYCPQARLGAAIYKRSDLSLMCPGWDWPADPAATLEASRASGRTIALDLNSEDWWGAHEAADLVAIRAWANRHSGRDVAGFFVVDR